MPSCPAAWWVCRVRRWWPTSRARGRRSGTAWRRSTRWPFTSSGCCPTLRPDGYLTQSSVSRVGAGGCCTPNSLSLSSPTVPATTKVTDPATALVFSIAGPAVCAAFRTASPATSLVLSQTGPAVCAALTTASPATSLVLSQTGPAVCAALTTASPATSLVLSQTGPAVCAALTTASPATSFALSVRPSVTPLALSINPTVFSCQHFGPPDRPGRRLRMGSFGDEPTGIG